jgi:hypothetical protein
MVLTKTVKEALWLIVLVDNLDLSHEFIVIHYDS